MARREYTAGSPTTLASAFAAGATSFTITSDTNWPTSTDYDFFVTIEGGTAQEERVLCSARTGTTVTVATGGRGKDSTGDKAHAAGATIWPSWSAQDADEANAHIESTGYASFSKTVHGLGSSDGVVVGTDKAQTLTAKTLASPTITGTITGAVITSANIVDGTIVDGDINASAAIDWTKLAVSSTVSSTELGYVDGVTSAIQTQLDSKAPLNPSTNAQTGTTYTLVLGDASKYVEMNNASANTLTVPPNSSVAFPVGTEITVIRTGAGLTTIAPGSGVIVNYYSVSGSGTRSIKGQWSAATLVKRATDTWVLIGNLT